MTTKTDAVYLNNSPLFCAMTTKQTMVYLQLELKTKETLILAFSFRQGLWIFFLFFVVFFCCRERRHLRDGPLEK